MAHTEYSTFADQLEELIAMHLPVGKSTTGHDLTLPSKELTVEIYPGMVRSVADTQDPVKMSQMLEVLKALVDDKSLDKKGRKAVVKRILTKLSELDTLIVEKANQLFELCEHLHEIQQLLLKLAAKLGKWVMVEKLEHGTIKDGRDNFKAVIHALVDHCKGKKNDDIRQMEINNKRKREEEKEKDDKLKAEIAKLKAELAKKEAELDQKDAEKSH